MFRATVIWAEGLLRYTVMTVYRSSVSTVCPYRPHYGPGRSTIYVMIMITSTIMVMMTMMMMMMIMMMIWWYADDHPSWSWWGWWWDDAMMMICIVLSLCWRCCLVSPSHPICSFDGSHTELRVMLKMLFAQPLPCNLLIFILQAQTEQIKMTTVSHLGSPGPQKCETVVIKKTRMKSGSPVFATPPTRNAHFWSKIKISSWRWYRTWCIGFVY